MPNTIEYDFRELLQANAWVRNIFVKGTDVPNLANMCNLLKSPNSSCTCPTHTQSLSKIEEMFMICSADSELIEMNTRMTDSSICIMPSKRLFVMGGEDAEYIGGASCRSL